MTNIVKTITDTEYQSLNDYQTGYYMSTNEDDPISMRYHHFGRKKGWHNTLEEILEVEEKKDGKHYYDVEKKFDFLKGIIFRCVTPEIKVSSDYVDTVRIRMSHNILHHIHGACIFSSGDGATQTITPLFLDDIFQTSIGNRDQYSEKIGNRKSLTTWTTHLKAELLTMQPPWFFTLHNSKAFPLYESCLEKNKIQFICDFELDISKLVEMQGKDESTGTWTRMKFSLDYLDEETEQTIKSPEMWGIYSNISKEEKELRKKTPQNTRIDYNDINEIVTHDIKTYEQTIPVHLTSSDPVYGVSWKAKNELCKTYNSLSNYTTNPLDHSLGFNPIMYSGIKYGTIPRVKEREHDHFDQSLPERYFGRYPFENGYNYYFFDDEPLTLSVGNSLVLDSITKSKVTLDCTLGDTSKISQDQKSKRKKKKSKKVVLYPSEKKNSKDQPQFKIFTLLYVRKSIIFDKKRNQVYHITDDMSLKNYNERMN